MWEPNPGQVVEAARQALRVPDGQRNAAMAMVGRDVALLEAIETEIAECDRQLAEVLPLTPAGILTTIPGVAVTTASYYGAALGDPHRFRNTDAAYRYSGLSPTSYESGGRKSGWTRISREGSVEFRYAIVTMGRGVRKHEPDFAAYYRRLVSAGKPPLVALIAVGHRAHRLAFSMMRNQSPYDGDRWVRAVEQGSGRQAHSEVAYHDVPDPHN